MFRSNELFEGSLVKGVFLLYHTEDFHHRQALVDSTGYGYLCLLYLCFLLNLKQNLLVQLLYCKPLPAVVEK